uniref:Coiled-coil domain containing 190 n=1 Tax=Chelydra serpentina TaxID=8475 RepID=A0A8C3SAQ6_CHESE
LDRSLLWCCAIWDFPLERRDVKQAEARLSHGLQDLEEARLYHMNSIIKEQRQIQKELQRLQQGEAPFPSPPNRAPSPAQVTKKPSKLRHAVRRDPAQQQAWQSKQWGKCEAPRSTLPKMEGPARAVQSPLQHQTCNRDVLDDAGQESSGRDAMPKPTSCTERRKPSLGYEKLSSDTDAYAPDSSHLRTTHSRPGFLELYAEARNARYIRHKGIPASEKELSLQEIFGHENSLYPIPPAAEQEQHNPE